MDRAYLRGLLKRDYRMGVQSRMREDRILELIDAEEAAHVMERQAQVAAPIAARSDPEMLRKTLQDLLREITHASLLRAADLAALDESRAAASPERSALVYQILQRAGMIASSPEDDDDEIVEDED